MVAIVGYWACAASALLAAVSLVGWTWLLYDEGPDASNSVMALVSLIVLIFSIAMLTVLGGGG